MSTPREQHNASEEPNSGPTRRITQSQSRIYAQHEQRQSSGHPAELSSDYLNIPNQAGPALTHDTARVHGRKHSREDSTSASSFKRSKSSISWRDNIDILELLIPSVELYNPHDYKTTLQFLPDDVRSLYEQIHTASIGGGILPGEIQADIIDAEPGLGEHYFRPVDETNLAASKKIWEKMKDLRLTASSYGRSESFEGMRHIFVFAPFLTLVFEEPGKAVPPVCSRIVSISGTPLEEEYIPKLRVCKEEDKDLLDKKIDWVVAVELPKSSTLYDTIIQATETRRLRDFNATEDYGIRYSPIAVMIETRPTIQRSDPLVLLTCWAVARRKKMLHLRQNLNDTRNVPSIPLIEMVGETWYLYFACDGDRGLLNIVGPIPIGGTLTYIDMYKAYTILTAIRGWAETTYLAAIEAWLGAAEGGQSSV
ncbi:hypothetical protein F5B22DRAFT_643804 [Xylaria bambusicola]|uniref:uncharacterized protein n=1 Tax=Xylaria bambusicola TaxID=326684 RepID=UPI0020089EE2|nr:uncharacterized protein F5B22DRAFT_643804 [Xylaria bambusicola]KAI0521630.1 hypothetical protein F5B22DRAFT_643804 [Xylaria bambusicola]